MSPEQLKEIREREFAIYKQEVSAAADPKLHILLVHLYVEHLLERYLSAKLKTTTGLVGKNGLTFEKKARLVASMGGLSAQRIDSVLKLNGLRNDCAHSFRYQPTVEELEAFGRTLGKAYTALKQQAGGNHNSCMRACCARLCGELLRIVVNVEHGDS